MYVRNRKVLMALRKRMVLITFEDLPKRARAMTPELAKTSSKGNVATKSSQNQHDK